MIVLKFRLVPRSCRSPGGIADSRRCRASKCCHRCCVDPDLLDVREFRDDVRRVPATPLVLRVMMISAVPAARMAAGLMRLRRPGVDAEHSFRIEPLTTKVSPPAPSVPPLTMSRPSGVSPSKLAFQVIVSSSASAVRVSFPAPPSRVSLPAPPFRCRCRRRRSSTSLPSSRSAYRQGRCRR